MSNCKRKPLTSNDFRTLKYVNGITEEFCDGYEDVENLLQRLFDDLETSDDPATDVIGSDGLIHTIPATPTVVMNDTPTIEFQETSPAPDYVFAADVIISEDVDNAIAVNGDGLYVQRELPSMKSASVVSLTVVSSAEIPENSGTPLNVSLPGWTTPWTASITVTNDHVRDVKVAFTINEVLLECYNAFGINANIQAVLFYRINSGTWISPSRAVTTFPAFAGYKVTQPLYTQLYVRPTLSPEESVTVEYALVLNEVGGGRNFNGTITVKGVDVVATAYAKDSETWLS